MRRKISRKTRRCRGAGALEGDEDDGDYVPHFALWSRVGSSPWVACAGSPSPMQQNTAASPDWSPLPPQQQQIPRPKLIQRGFSDPFAQRW